MSGVIWRPKIRESFLCGRLYFSPLLSPHAPHCFSYYISSAFRWGETNECVVWGALIIIKIEYKFEEVSRGRRG